jgi:hypothetical protein
MPADEFLTAQINLVEFLKEALYLDEIKLMGMI